MGATTWLPALRATIGRRILVNYRIDPDALSGLLPDPFEPRTVDGYAIGGVCCIRLVNVRPKGIPESLGVASENAAHRFGVETELRPAASIPATERFRNG